MEKERKSIMIEIRNLTKKFGGVIAVNELNLEVKKGELFVLLGPNGAGKTTTIKLITGLIYPTEGEIKVGRYSITEEYKKAKRIIGYIPDTPYLYDKLTAKEFLYFIQDIYEVNNRERVKELLELFNLKDESNRLIESYSHGMRQKVAIASALIHNPEILVIDEPLVGLDPRSARLFKDILKQEVKKGVTVFLSTHTLPLAEELAHRIGIINEGRLMALGNLKELRRLAKISGNLEDVFLKLTKELDERIS